MYMMKMSSASSSSPASTASATTHPGTDPGGSATHTTDRLTAVLLDGSSARRFLYGISMTLKEAVDRTTYERFWFSA